MNNFDIDKLTKFAITVIQEFADNHPNENFYGFAIDANLLCFNSEERFKTTLQNYRERWGGYTDGEQIKGLKHNTGDWHYQGFAEFSDETGFDMDAYLEHYHADDEYQGTSDYTKAMNRVITMLKKSSAFDTLNKTDDFFIMKIEHDY